MIDTHTHLQMPDFTGDWSAILKRMEDADLEYAVVVGFDIESSKRAVALTEQNERILAVVGVHPHDASTLDSASLDESGGHWRNRPGLLPEPVAA
jgi:TatD DNase family protein